MKFQEKINLLGWGGNYPVVFLRGDRNGLKIKRGKSRGKPRNHGKRQKRGRS